MVTKRKDGSYLVRLLNGLELVYTEREGRLRCTEEFRPFHAAETMQDVEGRSLLAEALVCGRIVEES